MSDSWKTPATRAAEGRVDDAVQAAERRAAETRRFLAERASSPELDDEVKRLFQAHARSRDAPAPIRALYRRIAVGEITWDDVFAGRAGTDEIRAAVEANAPALDALREKFSADEGAEDALGADTDTDPSAKDPAELWAWLYGSHATGSGRSEIDVS